MRLKSWMRENDISVNALAEKLQMDKTTVHKYRNGTRRPSLHAAIKIQKITNGQVTVEDMNKNHNS